MTLLLVALLFLTLGLLIGRVAAAAAAPLVVAAWYGGLAAEWWGNGVGDGWQPAAIVTAGVATLATIGGVALRRHSDRRSKRPSETPRRRNVPRA